MKLYASVLTILVLLAGCGESQPAGDGAGNGQKAAQPEKALAPERVNRLKEGTSEGMATPEEQRLFDALLAASETNDWDRTRALAFSPEVRGSTNADLRTQAVASLAWFGEKAIDDLVEYVKDEDEEVYSAAIGEWSTVLALIEDDRQRADKVSSAMKRVSRASALEQIAMECNSLPGEFAAMALLDVIENGTIKQRRVAAEAYSFVTGEDFESREKTLKWIEENKE